MKIIVYSINFTPELAGIGKYTGDLCRWLGEKNHQVQVVTAPPYYPTWRVWETFSAKRYQTENFFGGKVFRCPLWVPSAPSGIKRILHLASFAISSLPVMLVQIFWRPQVVIVIEPPLFCAPVAWMVGRLSGSKTVLHIQDFEVDAAFDLGIIRSGFLRRNVSRVESFLMRRFDCVSTISDRMLERLKLKGVPEEKTYLFSNWADLESIYPQGDVSPMRAELGFKPADIVALYSGNMGEKQGLEVVIDAAQRMQDMANVYFVMCGEGAAYQRLQQLGQGLQNIRWLPLQPLEKLNDLLNMADIHLLPQRAGAEDLVMPSKLTGMLASGRPVLATANPGTQVALTLKGAGVVVPPGDTQQFIEALKTLANDPSMRQQMGIIGREYAIKAFDREAVLTSFEKMLHSLLKTK